MAGQIELTFDAEASFDPSYTVFERNAGISENNGTFGLELGSTNT